MVLDIACVYSRPSFATQSCQLQIVSCHSQTVIQQRRFLPSLALSAASFMLQTGWQQAHWGQRPLQHGVQLGAASELCMCILDLSMRWHRLYVHFVVQSSPAISMVSWSLPTVSSSLALVSSVLPLLQGLSGLFLEGSHMRLPDAEVWQGHCSSCQRVFA